MTTIYDLKPRFQALLRPVSDALVRARLSANDVTLGALLLSAAHGAWLGLMPGSRWPLLLLPVTLFLRMAFNAIDGMMAKEHGQKRGRRRVERAQRRDRRRSALSPVCADTQPQCCVVLARWRRLAPSPMAGAPVSMIGAPRRYDGPLGKSDRAFAFGLLAVLLGIGIASGLWSTLYLAALLLLSGAHNAQPGAQFVAEAKGRQA